MSDERPKDPKSLAGWIVFTMNALPNDWTLCQYNATHKSGLEMWIASGAGCLKIERPFRMTFGWWQARRIWKAVERLKSYKASRMLVMEELA